MNSIFGFVVGLLQAALSLIGFVQQHPELPPAAQQQAQQVAQQAIMQATKALASNSATAGWKTYTNAAVGFTIKYPSQYVVDASTNVSDPQWKALSLLSIYDSHDSSSNEFHVVPVHVVLQKQPLVYQGTTYHSLAALQQSHLIGADKAELVTIGGQQALRYPVSGGDGAGDAPSQQYIFLNNDILYEIFVRAGDPYVDQMLQSITFTSDSSSADNGTNAAAGNTVLSSSPVSGYSPLTVTFSAIIPDGRNVVPKLDFDDGANTYTFTYAKTLVACPNATSQNCNSISTAHTYSAPGIYNVQLIRCSASDERECMPETIGTATITVMNASQSNVFVPGMSKYTDSNFGFSFWYPTGWTVEQKTPQEPVAAGNAQLKKELIVASTTDSSVKVVLFEYSSEDKSISFSQDAYALTYYFDSATHTWMRKDMWSNQPSYNKTTPVDVRPTLDTMGGLHVLTPAFSFNHDGERGDNLVVPLSAHNFVDIFSSVHDDLDVFAGYLARTIVAADPAVATPWDTVAQTKVVGYERERYKTGAFYMSPSGHAQ